MPRPMRRRTVKEEKDMKKVYEAPAMERVYFASEEILSISSIFNSLSSENDNEGTWKWD